MKAWTKAEEDFLKQYYPLYGIEYCSVFLQRSKKAIRAKKDKLNVKLGHKIRRWASDENGFRVCGACLEQKLISDFPLNVGGYLRRKCKSCYYQERYSRDKTYSYRVLVSRLRRRIRHALKGTNKTQNTLSLIGCSQPELIRYLKSKLTHDMTWSDVIQGRIHIDHIRPCATFNLNDPTQQKTCFHFSNLQPLWATDNLRKGAKCSTLQSA